MKLGHSGSRLWSCLLLSFLLSISFSIGIRANVQEPNTIWYDTDLQIVGVLTYMGSSTSTQPVDKLSGVHAIELCTEAENKLIKEPYLTSVSQTTVSGVVDTGYNAQFGFGTYLQITQPHYNQNNTGTRDAVAYYRVDVSRIDTNLLYRPERSQNLIAVVTGGCILIGIYTVLKWVRR